MNLWRNCDLDDTPRCGWCSFEYWFGLAVFVGVLAAAVITWGLL